MAIVSSDIKAYLSGGASNSNVNASLGGVKSSEVVPADALNNLWDQVSGDESSAGDTEYRIIYIENDHASLEATNVRAFFKTNESSYLTIGVNVAKNTNATLLTNEETAPSGVTFSAASTKANAVSLGDLDHGDYRALYIKRVIPASTGPNDEVDWNIQIVADTPE